MPLAALVVMALASDTGTEKNHSIFRCCNCPSFNQELKTLSTLSLSLSEVRVEPMEVHDGADIHLQPMQYHMLEQGGYHDKVYTYITLPKTEVLPSFGSAVRSVHKAILLFFFLCKILEGQLNFAFSFKFLHFLLNRQQE